MVLNKFVTYLYYVGCFVMGIGIAGKLLTQMLIYLSWEQIIHKNVFIYMTAVGIFLMVPSWIYKLYHFNAYKKENKDRLLTFALVIVGVLIMIYIVRGV